MSAGDTSEFSIRLANDGLGPWSWSVIDQDGSVISRGDSDQQDEARRRAMVTAQSLSAFRRVTGAW